MGIGQKILFMFDINHPILGVSDFDPLLHGCWTAFRSPQNNGLAQFQAIILSQCFQHLPTSNCCFTSHIIHMEVSWNGDSHKSSILMGFYTTKIYKPSILGYSHLWRPSLLRISCATPWERSCWGLDVVPHSSVQRLCATAMPSM